MHELEMNTSVGRASDSVVLYGGADPSRAAARAVDAARASSASFELFGSFTLCGEEFALPAASIREVVNYPARIVPVPLAPPFLEGVFSLRGNVIPVLNLARIFDPLAAPADASQKIIIVDHDEILVGILLHSTGEVLRVKPEQRSVMQYQTGDAHAVIAGTIVLDDGARLLQILDAHALVRIDNVPQVQALRATARVDRQHFHLQAERRQCISFHVGGIGFAFDIGAIREIIPVPELKSSIMHSALCLGRINFRGEAVAVIDFAALMKLPPDGNAVPAERRILIARVGTTLIGLLVDAVSTMFNFFNDELMAIPLLSAARASMFAGCVTREPQGDILILNHEGIFSHAELLEISTGHTNLYQSEAQAEAGQQSRTARARRAAYVVFSLDGQWAVELRQLREIIPCSAGMVRPPAMPAFVHGIHQLRGQMITVIDLRVLYGMEASSDKTASRILVVEHGAERYGLLVDGVDNIIHVEPGQRRTSPRMLCGGGQAQEVIDVSDDTGHGAALNVFDLPALLAQLDAER